MDKEKLKIYAISYYEYCRKYLDMVLHDFPEDKMDEKFGEAKTAGELLFHSIATPHFWMKRADRPMPFRARFETIAGALELWDRQLEHFKELLQDEDELIWKPTKSIPWIMIRACNHLVHHLGMIIYIRNILGLPSLEPLGEFKWSTLVDLTGNQLFTD